MVSCGFASAKVTPADEGFSVRWPAQRGVARPQASNEMAYFSSSMKNPQFSALFFARAELCVASSLAFCPS